MFRSIAAFRGAGFFVAIAFAAPVLAADASEPLLRFSLGVGAAPEYEGADEYRVLPLPGFEFQGRKVALRTNGPGLEADLIPSPQFEAGPLIRYRRGRDDEVDDNAVARLAEVDASVEVGAFFATGLPLAELGFDDPATLTMRVSFAHDIAEGHDGFLVSGAVGVVRPLTDRLKGVLSLSTTYASANYMSAFFDVTAAGAAASGLNAYTTSAGLKDVGLTGVLAYQFTDYWSVRLVGVYSRLIGDAADSPIVKDAGAPDQFFGGLVIGYRAY